MPEQLSTVNLLLSLGIGCSLFLQAMFFAVALRLALKLNRTSRATKGQVGANQG